MSRLGKINLRSVKTDERFNPLLENLARRITPELKNFGHQGVANVMHALAKLKEPRKDIMLAVDEDASWLVGNGTPQNIANTA